jgi:hypothetical protein
VDVGGVVLARVVEIINGYTVTFEDGMYRVTLVGANSNISDVTNLNQVSIASTNSAGLIVSGSGVTQQDKDDITGGVWNELLADHVTAGSYGFAQQFLFALSHHKVITDPVAGTYKVYDVDETTVLYSASLWQDAAGTIPYAGAGAERRNRMVP